MSNNLYRAILHFPAGVLAAALITIVAPLGLLFGVTFLTYEISQDWRKGDNAFKDILGFAWGIGAGGVGYAIWGLVW